ncbi:hypothetical protein AB0J80_31185 [Actinoplanes sp. NPDC049548]|uniref:hypothetical protein n=1 Tax=Actinoplanes sp. NPDC049548 TaxID=3155152 RepID=UPI00342F0B8C
MFPRRTIHLTVSAATLTAALGYAVPAAASVRYDAETKSGYADAADVRKAFGWSDHTLAARAADLAFSHDFWTNDTYSVSCGKGSFRIEHQSEFGRFELTDRVVREPRRGGSTGYGESSRTAGFRITGPYAGISGTSLPPAVGQSCPEPRGPRVTRAELVSTTSGWSLTVSFGDVSRILRSGR